MNKSVPQRKDRLSLSRIYESSNQYQKQANKNSCGLNRRLGLQAVDKSGLRSSSLAAMGQAF